MIRNHVRWSEVLAARLAPHAAFPHNLSLPSLERQLVVDGRHYPYWDHVIWCGALANFAYLPATAMPIAFTSAGLPMGIQIVGPYLDDRTPIHAAELMDDLSEASYDLRDLRETHMGIELKSLIDEACRPSNETSPRETRQDS